MRPRDSSNAAGDDRLAINDQQQDDNALVVHTESELGDIA
jgi:hypothetical protein